MAFGLVTAESKVATLCREALCAASGIAVIFFVIFEDNVSLVPLLKMDLTLFAAGVKRVKLEELERADVSPLR